MITQRAYKFRFYPTRMAIEFSHARFVWNWAFELKNKAYEERKKWLNYIALSRKLTEIKKTNTHG